MRAFSNTCSDSHKEKTETGTIFPLMSAAKAYLL